MSYRSQVQQNAHDLGEDELPVDDVQVRMGPEAEARARAGTPRHEKRF